MLGMTYRGIELILNVKAVDICSLCDVKAVGSIITSYVSYLSSKANEWFIKQETWYRSSFIGQLTPTTSRCLFHESSFTL